MKSLRPGVQRDTARNCDPFNEAAPLEKLRGDKQTHDEEAPKR